MIKHAQKDILEQIEGYANTLMQSYRILDERRHILEPLLHDDEIKEALNTKFNSTYGSHAYNHLVPLLAQDLLRDISRLFLDEDKRSGSLVNIYRKANVTKVHDALKHKFRHIPDKWHDNPSPIPGLSQEATDSFIEGWRDKDRDDFEQSFIDGWSLVSEAVENIKSDPNAKKIKTFRDSYHAHLQITPLGEDPGPFDVQSLGLTYNDILDFLDKYKESIFELARVLTGGVHDMEGFSEAHQHYGNDMWRILAGLDSAE